jgi:intergrase/recombinase
MPPRIKELMDKVNERFGTKCNHCVITFYWDGKDFYIPPHQDKAHSKESKSKKVEDAKPIINMALGSGR